MLKQYKDIVEEYNIDMVDETNNERFEVDSKLIIDYIDLINEHDKLLEEKLTLETILQGKLWKK